MPNLYTINKLVTNYLQENGNGTFLVGEGDVRQGTEEAVSVIENVVGYGLEFDSLVLNRQLFNIPLTSEQTDLLVEFVAEFVRLKEEKSLDLAKLNDLKATLVQNLTS